MAKEKGDAEAAVAEKLAALQQKTSGTIAEIFEGARELSERADRMRDNYSGTTMPKSEPPKPKCKKAA